MSFTKIDDYDPIIRNLIVEQFKDTDIEKVFTGAANTQFEEIETVLKALFDERWLDTAVGAQLDFLGRILNAPRLGRDDSSYRTILQVKSFAFTAYGKIETIIEAIKVLYMATDVEYTPDYPAGAIFTHDGAGGLFLQEELHLDDASPLLLDDGEPLLVLIPDTISETILETITPAGVEITIQNFP